MIAEELFSDFTQLVRQLQYTELWAFAGASALLWYIGRHVAGSHGDRQRLGWRAAYFGFLAYCICGYLEDSAVTAELFISLMLRGVLFGGSAAGIAWISSPLILELVKLASLTIRTLRRALAVPINLFNRRSQAAKSREQAAINKQRAEEQVERDRNARDEEHRRQTAERDARQAREETQRAADVYVLAARHLCESAYDRFRPGIAARWPESKFKKCLDAYLVSTLPREMIDRHADEIRRVIQHHGERMADEREFLGAHSIDELHMRMEEQRKYVRAMNISPDMVEELLCEIDQAFQEQARKIIGEL